MQTQKHTHTQNTTKHIPTKPQKINSITQIKKQEHNKHTTFMPTYTHTQRHTLKVTATNTGPARNSKYPVLVAMHRL